MDDPQIRQAFHNTYLPKKYDAPSALILDELGLQHGACRADIAVIDGRFDGYEIKSDADTLVRLGAQIISYNAIFDRSTIIVGAKHLKRVKNMIPDWWGIILVAQQGSEDPRFELVREPRQNEHTDSYALAQLLWREEVQAILAQLGFRGTQLRQRRAILYGYLVDAMPACQLRQTVSEYLKKRQSWRRL